MVKQILASVGGFSAAIALVAVVLDAPARLDAHERTDQQHAADILELQAADLRLQQENEAMQRAIAASARDNAYLVCLTEFLAGEGRRSPIQCASDRDPGPGPTR